MNETTPPEEAKPSNFPFFKNVSQANRFARRVLGPDARVYFHRYATDPGRRFGIGLNHYKIQLAVGPTINDAFEAGFADGLIPNKPKTYTKPPRKVSRKMLARAFEGKANGALGPAGQRYMASL